MLTDHKLQRVLTRFPWLRNKPRDSDGRLPIGYRDRDGQQLWADSQTLAEFADPGPALVCVALHSDVLGRRLVCSLVEHHAATRGVAMPAGGVDVTRTGLDLLDDLIEAAGLDPAASVGAHPIREVLAATWAVAAAVDR